MATATREYAVERLENVPEVIRDKMRAALEKGIVLARKKHPPGDGNMNILFDEDFGSWTLQVTFFHDERMWAGPHVVVSAFSEPHGDMTGRLAAKVEYTHDDRLALARLRLDALKADRMIIDAEIEKLEAILSAGVE
jgi:hypothetical protein